MNEKFEKALGSMRSGSEKSTFATTLTKIDGFCKEFKSLQKIPSDTISNASPVSKPTV